MIKVTMGNSFRITIPTRPPTLEGSVPLILAVLIGSNHFWYPVPHYVDVQRKILSSGISIHRHEATNRANFGSNVRFSVERDASVFSICTTFASRQMNVV
jgi:hypothetical protein